LALSVVRFGFLVGESRSSPVAQFLVVRRLDSRSMKKPIVKQDPELKAKLKKSEPEVQDFVCALQAENLRLHKKIARYQAETVSAQSRVRVEEHHAQKRRKLEPLIDKRLTEARRALFGELPEDKDSTHDAA
jgi:hypothetical protein